jgi:hypothetical protein
MEENDRRVHPAPSTSAIINDSVVPGATAAEALATVAASAKNASTRVVVAPEGEDPSISLELPPAVDRRDFLLGFTATGAVTTARVATAADVDTLVARGISVVASMAQLRSARSFAGTPARPAPASAGGAVVFLRGYRAPLDGGEGFFVWDPASTAADDGGTIIAPDASSAGRWRRSWSGPFNVGWFASPMDAIRALAATGRPYKSHTLYFPSREEPYNLGGATIPDYVSLVGEGRYSQLCGSPTFSSVDTSYTRSTVSNITFTDVVNLSKAREVLFNNCRFENTVLFNPVNLSHYNTFFHCTWQAKGIAVNCVGRNHFNKIISCRISYVGQEAAIRIGKDSEGNVGDAWTIIGTSIEGHWADAGPFGPCFDLDGKGHYCSGIYMEIPAGKKWAPGPVLLRGSGIDFSFSRITGEGGIENVGADNKVSGRRYVLSKSAYGVAERRGSLVISPDAKGQSSFSHGLWAIPSVILVNTMQGGAVSANVLGFDDDKITVMVTDGYGKPVSGGSFKIMWLAAV